MKKISQLKANVQARKDKKLKKRLEQNTGVSIDVPATGLTPTWKENLDLLNDTFNLINSYKQITVVAHGFIKIKKAAGDPNISNIVDMVTVMSDDIGNLLSRVNDIVTSIGNRTGMVSELEYPHFYLIYETISQLYADVNSVLADNAMGLTTFLNSNGESNA